MSAYFAPLVLAPIIIDAPGQYVTRNGEVVHVARSSGKHDFGCAGTYSNNVREHWHKSGRLFASRETVNDVVAKHHPSGRHHVSTAFS